MAHAIGFVDNTGSEGLAHWQMLLKIKTFAEANGWTTLRYVNPTDGSNRELILQGAGLSGTEQIFIGFRTYHNVGADYYNLSCAAFTGYVAANAFTAQPGYVEFGVCGHNQRIDYWLAVNAQRIFFGLKVGTPVYEVGYTGKFFPYATPGQYPYPMACIGTLNGVPATRYSDTNTTHSSGVKGTTASNSVPKSANGALRDVAGIWQQFCTLPWSTDYNNSATLRRPTGSYYSAMKTVLMSVPTPYGNANQFQAAGNVWGELDGIRYITGFNNVTENTMTIDGVTHVVLQDVFRTGLGDYFLLEMN